MFKLQPFLFSTLSCPDARRTCEDAGLCAPQAGVPNHRLPKGAGLFGARPTLTIPTGTTIAIAA